MTNLITTPFDGGPPIGHTAGRNVRAAPVCIPGADKPYLPENLAGAVSFEWQSRPLFERQIVTEC